jgi:hypothetical protein
MINAKKIQTLLTRVDNCAMILQVIFISFESSMLHTIDYETHVYIYKDFNYLIFSINFY